MTLPGRPTVMFSRDAGIIPRIIGKSLVRFVFRCAVGTTSDNSRPGHMDRSIVILSARSGVVIRKLTLPNFTPAVPAAGFFVPNEA